MKSNLANKCLIHSLLLCFVLAAVLAPIVGCTADEVVATLQTADAVDQAAITILAPANGPMALVLSAVDKDLQTVIKGYQDYEAALPADKVTKGDLVKATVASIQANLQQILADVGVKNPGLLSYITKAVAIVNTAMVIVLARVTGTRARSIVVSGNDLPLITGAKTAKDLKAQWNNTVKADFPQAKI